MNPTRRLAEFTADLEAKALPLHTRGRVRHIIIDAIASALAGRGADEVRTIESLARKTMGSGRSTVIGSGTTLSPAGACLVNGYEITAVTVCDIHRPTLCHVTPGVIPCALAVGEERGTTGSEFVTAVAAGLETTVRVGLGLHYPTFRAQGWHSPGVSGTMGAAVAASKLMGLTADGVTNALGIAGSQAAGTFASYGSPTLKFHQGRGSMSGLLGAYLAEENFRGSSNILTHPDGGLLHSYSDGGRPEAITADLGEKWELESIALRRWPVSAQIQSMATGLFELLGGLPRSLNSISRVHVELPQASYEMHGKMGWREEFQSHLSAPYVAGVILRDRTCWMEQFTEEARNDPDLNRFIEERVEVNATEDLPDAASRVRVEFDGDSLESQVDMPKGEPDNPLSEHEIMEKFHQASKGILSSEQVSTAWSLLESLDDLDDVARLTATLCNTK